MDFYSITFICLFLAASPSTSSPIMVKFGTNEGPIIPPPSTTTSTPPSSYTSRPAPVYERQDDIPNPTVYKPLVPHQYRTKIYKNKPSPNLILGTPLDQKYTPGLQKYSGYSKLQKSLGVDYRGPQIFGYQDYEKKYQNLDSPKNYKGNFGGEKGVKEGQEIIYEVSRDQEVSASKYVPQIGIIYSAGVRYYVPQIVYYNSDDVDNSVYEANDLKYYYHNRERNY